MHEKKKVLYFSGPPLGGKGTSAEFLQEFSPNKYHHLSTGTKIKEYVKNTPPELKNHINELIKGANGPMVGAGPMGEILDYAIKEDINSGLYIPSKQIMILDVFPRTISQIPKAKEDFDAVGMVFFHIFDKYEEIMQGKISKQNFVESYYRLLDMLELRRENENRLDDDEIKAKKKIFDYYENLVWVAKAMIKEGMIPKDKLFNVYNTGSKENLKEVVKTIDSKLIY